MSCLVLETRKIHRAAGRGCAGRIDRRPALTVEDTLNAQIGWDVFGDRKNQWESCNSKQPPHANIDARQVECWVCVS